MTIANLKARVAAYVNQPFMDRFMTQFNAAYEPAKAALKQPGVQMTVGLYASTILYIALLWFFFGVKAMLITVACTIAVNVLLAIGFAYFLRNEIKGTTVVNTKFTAE